MDKQERERLRANLAVSWTGLNRPAKLRLLDALDAAEQRAEAAERDAARYGWLRGRLVVWQDRGFWGRDTWMMDIRNGAHLLNIAPPGWPGDDGDSAAVDAAIDAARADPLAPTPFDLDRARAGAPLVMRNGRSARIGIFDSRGASGERLVGAATDPDGHERATVWHSDGRFLSDGQANEFDLFMASQRASDGGGARWT